MSRFLLILLIFCNFIFQNLPADIIKKIEIVGNKRIANQSVILFGDIKTNVNLTARDFDKILKNLYQTNFFENVKLEINGEILKIFLVENKIIQKVVFEGIKRSKIRDELYNIVTLKDKSSFIEYQAKNDLRVINNFLRSLGYYFAEVKTTTVDNPNNTINLTYDIKLGEKALIGNIKFIGDKKFKNRKLRSIIVSEEDKPWNFLSSTKFLDKSRINLDIRLLKNFYINKGYYDVKIVNSSAKFYDDKRFELIFNINSGNKFYFNDLKLVLPKDYDKKNFSEITIALNTLKNNVYSYNRIEDILNEIDQIALSEQYEFINAEVEETIVDKNKLNFSIIIKETKKFYVEKVNIFGNNITREKVIRDVLIVDEGDAFNEILHNKSLNTLKGKNIFKSVSSDVVDGSTLNKKIINLNVEEKPTGEISAGAGIGTTGGSIAFSIKENNYMGKGVKLRAGINLSSETVRGSFSITNPNYKYTDRSLTTTLESTATDRLSGFGYKTTKTGVSFSTSSQMYEDFYIAPQISSYYESLETTDKASANLKKQKGD